MAKTRRKSDQDLKIKRAARELGIEEATLRHWMDTADDQELMGRAVELAHSRGIENVARNLGVDEATLRFRVWWEGESRQMEARRRQEEIIRRSREHPSWLENPPS